MLYLAKPVLTAPISSKFGWRFDPFNPKLVKKVWHSGIDFACPMGTEVHAAYEGEIIFSGLRGAYGLCLVVKHPSLGSVFTLYAHLSRILCPRTTLTKNASNAENRPNTVIALSGNTGASTGPHLHFEVRFPINGYAFCHNPEKYLIKG